MLIYDCYIIVLKAIFHLASIGNKKAAARINLLKTQHLYPQNIDKKKVWIHAASAGEFEQVVPLIEALKKEEDVSIIVSFFSISGIEIFKNHQLIDFCFLLPFDTKKLAHHLLDSIQPDIVIWTKYDFWFRILQQIHQRQIPVFLVNADLNLLLSKPWPYRFVILKCLPFFKTVFTVTSPSKQLNLSSYRIVQDTKWEQAIQNTIQELTDTVVEKFAKGRKIIIAGSTHEQDIKVIANTIHQSDFNTTVWILVPHETDENSLNSLTQIFHQHKISIYSEPTENANILIVDKKGLLKYLYRYAQVAYVGGGFGQGIHNILEAAAYNIPVICGPKIQKSNEAMVLNSEKILTVIKSDLEMRDAIIQFNEENRYVSIQQKTEMCFKEQLRNSPSELLMEALLPYLS